MPEAFRGKHMSYHDYVTGEGYDRIAKTPEWAEGICGIAASDIRSLAHSIAYARRLHVLSGWGPQRRSNGEWSAWAAMALPCLSATSSRRYVERPVPLASPRTFELASRRPQPRGGEHPRIRDHSRH